MALPKTVKEYSEKEMLERIARFSQRAAENTRAIKVIMVVVAFLTILAVKIMLTVN